MAKDCKNPKIASFLLRETKRNPVADEEHTVEFSNYDITSDDEKIPHIDTPIQSPEVKKEGQRRASHAKIEKTHGARQFSRRFAAKLSDVGKSKPKIEATEAKDKNQLKLNDDDDGLSGPYFKPYFGNDRALADSLGEVSSTLYSVSEAVERMMEELKRKVSIQGLKIRRLRKELKKKRKG